MFKVGQRVRVTQVESSPWWHFMPGDKDMYLNKIFKIGEYLGEAGDGTKAWTLVTPNGPVSFCEYQFRELKKKSEVKASAIVPVVNFKNEVNWLNKVKKNFENAGKVYQNDNGFPRPGGFGVAELNRIYAAQPDRPPTPRGVPMPVPTGRAINFDEMSDQAFVDELNTEPDDGNDEGLS
jgi:hypothetical protein